MADVAAAQARIEAVSREAMKDNHDIAYASALARCTDTLAVAAQVSAALLAWATRQEGAPVGRLTAAVVCMLYVELDVVVANGSVKKKYNVAGYPGAGQLRHEITESTKAEVLKAALPDGLSSVEVVAAACAAISSCHQINSGKVEALQLSGKKGAAVGYTFEDAERTFAAIKAQGDAGLGLNAQDVPTLAVLKKLWKAVVNGRTAASSDVTLPSMKPMEDENHVSAPAPVSSLSSLAGLGNDDDAPLPSSAPATTVAAVVKQMRLRILGDYFCGHGRKMDDGVVEFCTVRCVRELLKAVDAHGYAVTGAAGLYADFGIVLGCIRRTMNSDGRVPLTTAYEEATLKLGQLRDQGQAVDARVYDLQAQVARLSEKTK